MGRRTQRRRELEKEKLLLLAAIVGLVTKLIEMLDALISRLPR